MKTLYITTLLRSNYCRIVFLLSFFLGYYLLPEIVFHHSNRLLALVYLLIFASLMTCVVRAIKERAKAVRSQGGSLIGVLAAILGFSAFQFCGVAAPICGFSVGAGIVSVIFPNFLNSFFSNNGTLIIYFSIIIQLGALYYLGCLRSSK